ncbi:MAG TPA: hypothetical protein VEY51_07070 [Chondromyces sp.]|nr:hypothetical protein [Chondromyces sp.]
MVWQSPYDIVNMQQMETVKKLYLTAVGLKQPEYRTVSTDEEIEGIMANFNNVIAL